MSKLLLRQMDLFAGLADVDLDRLYEMAEPVSFPAGAFLMHEGDPGDAVYVVLDGILQVTKRSGQQELVLDHCGCGQVIGEISLLDQSTRTADVQAMVPARLLKIDGQAFQGLLASSPTAAQAILKTVVSRLRNTQVMVMQHEKLAALGTMSAGLAHELNNPASAVLRSAGQLRDALLTWQDACANLGALGLAGRAARHMEALQSEIARRAANPEGLDPLESSDRMSAIEEWLEAHDVEVAWELAPALADLGWRPEKLAEQTRDLAPRQVTALAGWLGTTALILMLLDETTAGAGQISQIVGAVKSYTHRDEAPFAEVDVREGLENTLVILHHKLRGGVTVHRAYEPNLPRIEAYPGELNQAWTNIIDNAIQAMDGHGELTIGAHVVDGRVIVDICDNGPGIPAEVLPRIFDVFYTTKAPGEGTGLGLHMVYNIVVHRHNGKVEVRSDPGHTCFSVSLPLRLPRLDGDSSSD
jgi:signal transduction histidine kinase